MFLHGYEGRVDLFGVGHIARHGKDPCLSQLSGGLASAGNGHPVAGVGERLCARQADAPVSSGNQYDSTRGRIHGL